MELSLYIKDKLVSGKRVAIPIMTHPGIELLETGIGCRNER